MMAWILCVGENVELGGECVHMAFLWENNILSYAVDTCCNMDQLFLQANENIEQIFNSFWANKLLLNTNKAKYKSPSKPCHTANHEACIYRIPLSHQSPHNNYGTIHQEHGHTFQGIFLDVFVKWKDHIKFIIAKITWSLFIIKQVNTFYLTKAYVYLTFHY